MLPLRGSIFPARAHLCCFEANVKQEAVFGTDERSTAYGHHWFHVARVHVHSLLLHMAPFMQQGFGTLHTVSSSYVYQLTSAWTLLSRFPATVSLLLTVPNDDSGILSVIPSALFISEAVSATGSLLLIDHFDVLQDRIQQQTLDQISDTSFCAGDGGTRKGLHSFFPEQSSTAFSEQNANIGEEFAHLPRSEEDLDSEVVFWMDDE